jgi:hypothetical protein
MSEPTAEQPAVTPTVTTAPARSRWRVSKLPSHLGRARTSTLVLAVLFLAIGTLYLNIRPETPGTTTTSDTGTVQPAPITTAPAPETTLEPSTTSAPQTTSAPTTSAEPTTTPTDEPTDTTTPEETTESSPPTSATPSSRPTTPTVVSPTG